MITKLGEKTFVTAWKYKEIFNGPADKDVVSTACVIKPYSPVKTEVKPDEVTIAWAHQAPEDNHCKETARKISFGRALKQMNLSREDRRAFWESYFNR